MEKIGNSLSRKEGEEKIDKDWFLAEISKRSTYDCINLIKEKNIPLEIIQSPEVQQAAKESMIERLSRGEIYDVIKIKEVFNVSEEIIQSPEVQKAAKEVMVRNLSGGDIDGAIKIKEALNVSEEIIQSPEVQKAAKEVMVRELSNTYIDSAIKIKETFNISEETIQSPEFLQAAKEGMIGILSWGRIDGAIKIKETFGIPEEIIQSPEVLQAAKEGMIKILSEGNIDSVIKIKEALNVSEETIQSPEVQQAAKEGMVKELYEGHMEDVIKIKETFNVSEELTQQVAKEGMIARLSWGRIDDVIKVKETFNVSEELTQQAVKEAIIRKFSTASFYTVRDVIEIKEAFNVPEETMQSPEVQQAAKETMIERLSGGYIDSAIKIKETFSIPEETIQSPEVQQAAKEGMIARLSKGNVNDAIEIKEAFNVPEEITQQAAKEGMIARLSRGEIYDVIEIKEAFSIPEETIRSPEVQEAAKEGVVKKLSGEHIGSAIKIKEVFNVSEEIIQSPEVQEAAKEGMIRELSGGYGRGISNAIKIKEVFNVSEEITQQAAKEAMIERLSRGEIYDVIKIKETFNISEETMQSPEVQKAAKEVMVRELSNRYIDFAIKIKETFSIPEETIQSPEVQQAAKEGMIKNLSSRDSSRDIDRVIKIKEVFNVSEEIIQSPEVQKAAKETMIERLSGGYIDSAIEIKEALNVPEELTQQAAKEGMIKNLSSRDSRRDIDRVIKIKEVFNVSEEIIQSPEVLQVAKEVMVKNLSNRYIDSAIKIKETFSIPEETIQSPEVQQAAKEGMIEGLSRGEIYDAIKIKETFNIPEEVAQQAAKEGIVKNLSGGDINPAIKIKETLNVLEEIIQSPEVQKAAKETMIERLSGGYIDSAIEIKEALNVPEELTQQAAKEGMIERLSRGYINDVIKIKETLNVSEEIIQSPEVQEAAKEKIIESFFDGIINTPISIKETLNVSEEIIQSPEVQKAAKTAILISLDGKLPNPEDVDKIKEAFNVPEDIRTILIEFLVLDESNLWGQLQNKEVLDLVKKDVLGDSWNYQNKLTIGENILIKKRLVEEKGLDLLRINEHEIEYDPQTERDYEYIFENIKGIEGSIWDQEDHEIKRAFEHGASYFGYKKMFQFVGDGDRHDRLFAFPQILNMAGMSGLRPEEFYARILLQVSHDDGTYDLSGGDGGAIDSYQKLNNIASLFEGIDVLEKIKKAREYDIQKIRDLVDAIEKPGDIFVNWKSLKNFADLVELLNKTQILEQLEGLSGEKGEKLKNYVEYLAFHPNINTQAVLRFWQRPGEFLGVGDSHSSQAHELKKPSNYVDIPYIDLAPEDLRDALVEGSLDRIQAWQPLEIEYKIPIGEISELTIVEQMKKGLGSRREKIPGMAKNPGLLFKQLNDLFKKEGIKFMDVLAGKVEIPETLNESLEDTLYDEEYGLIVPTKEYRLKIGLKSDPEIVVAGNDTACCMPFGSGKNNVYMYNPVCGQLVVQRKVGDSWRTVAQSVVTKDKDIKKNVSEIVAKFSGGEKHPLHEIFPEDILVREEDIMTCDNIEVSPNYTDKGDLEALYVDFFKEYAKRFGESENLDTERLIIGTGYADATFGQSVDNTFVPVAPVGYSDNIGISSKMVSLSSEGGSHLRKKVGVKEKPDLKEFETETNGVSSLTYADTLSVSYIEGKAYDDNPSLKEYLHNMENGLIAKDILNSHFDLPDMSFKYEDQDRKTQGYLLAYEGSYNQEKIIYISDLAANPGSKLAGGRLIKSFVEKYKREYLDKDKFIPIFTQARDKTSYKIITKQLDKISEKIGIKFELEEMGSRNVGGEETHNVMIRPVVAQ